MGFASTVQKLQVSPRPLPKPSRRETAGLGKGSSETHSIRPNGGVRIRHLTLAPQCPSDREGKPSDPCSKEGNVILRRAQAQVLASLEHSFDFIFGIQAACHLVSSMLLPQEKVSTVPDEQFSLTRIPRRHKPRRILQSTLQLLGKQSFAIPSTAETRLMYSSCLQLRRFIMRGP
jgi:hypothetical protein